VGLRLIHTHDLDGRRHQGCPQCDYARRVVQAAKVYDAEDLRMMRESNARLAAREHRRWLAEIGALPPLPARLKG
jgi:hypothetical protein